LSDVGQYTLAQIELFSASVAQGRKSAMRDAILATRAAQAESKALTKILKELD